MNVVTEIELVALAAIKPNPRNARKHSAKQIEHLKAIIGKVGFVVPALVDQDNRLIAGHGRLEAAKQLGMPAIPVIRLHNLNEAEFRILALADNRIAELADWDETVLKLELSELVLEDFELSIADLTGFDAPHIDALVFGSDFPAADSDDQQVEPPAVRVSEVGDIWRAEGMALGCLDALSAASYTALLGDARAGMVLTDPPYNVPIAGHVSGKGGTRHREFVQASGELSEAAFVEWLTQACSQLKQYAKTGALLYVFMDGAHLFELMRAARAAGLRQKSLVTWAKTNAGMGSLYRSQTEHVLVLKGDASRHTNNVQLGRFGRNRTTLWTYPGANTFGRDRDAALAQHPTCKPVALLKDAILDASERGEIILDPFAGSGSSLIAAHRVGRRAAALELDPLHIDAAIARIQAVTGVSFVRDRDGAQWSEVAAAAVGDAS